MFQVSQFHAWMRNVFASDGGINPLYLQVSLPWIAKDESQEGAPCRVHSTIASLNFPAGFAGSEAMCYLQFRVSTYSELTSINPLLGERRAA